MNNKRELIERVNRLRSETVMICQILPHPLDDEIEKLIIPITTVIEKLKGKDANE